MAPHPPWLAAALRDLFAQTDLHWSQLDVIGAAVAAHYSAAQKSHAGGDNGDTTLSDGDSLGSATGRELSLKELEKELLRPEQK